MLSMELMKLLELVDFISCIMSYLIASLEYGSVY